MEKYNPKTAFIIRMHFKKNDPRWEWRLAYFRSVVLPKILDQTDKDFDICMRVNKHHAEQVQALSDRIKIFDVVPEKNGYIDPKNRRKARKYFIDFIHYKYTVGLEKYDIQIGIDSDDMPLRNDFVERVKMECMRYPDLPLHISFQPHIFHVPTLRMFECPMNYGSKLTNGSPIFAIYQPKASENQRYIFAYSDSHLQLPNKIKRAIRIEEDYCCYSVHGKNSSTGLYPNLKQIMI